MDLTLGEPVYVEAASTRLGQVFVNVLTNARHALEDTDAGRIRVRLGREQDEVVVTLSDNGEGMPPDVLERAFEPFFTTKASGRGTGLGLALSREMVVGMGGSMAMTSRRGVGTSVYLRLPIARPEQHEQPAAPAVVPRDQRLRVLVIDDEPIVARAVARMLSSRHDTERCLSGAEALARIAAERFDVVVCDLMMPEVNGRDVYERVQSLDGFRPGFVFMSGGQFGELKDWTPPAALLAKPFATPTLLEAIDEAARAAVQRC